MAEAWGCPVGLILPLQWEGPIGLGWPRPGAALGLILPLQWDGSNRSDRSQRLLALLDTQAWLPWLPERTVQLHCWFLSAMVPYWLLFDVLLRRLVLRLRSVRAACAALLLLSLPPWLTFVSPFPPHHTSFTLHLLHHLPTTSFTRTATNLCHPRHRHRHRLRLRHRLHIATPASATASTSPPPPPPPF